MAWNTTILRGQLKTTSAADAGIGVGTLYAVRQAEETQRILQVVAWKALLDCCEGTGQGSLGASLATPTRLREVELRLAGLALP